MFSNFLKKVVDTVAPEVSAPRPPSHGFRVLKVLDPSPSSSAGIESFYDFLVAVDGVHLNGDTAWLQQYLKNAQDEITLSVWSVKGQVLRDCRVAPPSLTNRPLGVSLRWCPTHPTIENVYHVLEVAPNSPAAQAGLRSHEDYIVGTPEGIVRGESGMGELIEDHLGKPLKLFVFNAYYNTTRQVVLVANKQWGGQGSMGCGIGFGALHRLPRALNEPPEAPGQTLFEAPPAPDTSSFVTGAELSATMEVPETTAPPSKAGHATTTTTTSSTTKAKKKVTRMTAADIEAMAAEATLDSRPASRTANLPPPPKVNETAPTTAADGTVSESVAADTDAVTASTTETKEDVVVES